MRKLVSLFGNNLQSDENIIIAYVFLRFIRHHFIVIQYIAQYHIRIKDYHIFQLSPFPMHLFPAP